MRIVSGQLGGRTIKAPKTSGTRPMTDKVRGALFDVIGSIEGFYILDAYAGSGAVGFEALSRGAAQVVAIEAGRTAQQAIKQNQKDLQTDWGYLLYPVTVENWLAHQSGDRPQFDLIVADPPYEQLKVEVLEKLGQQLKPDGLLVVSRSSRKPIEPYGLRLVKTKDYGDSSLDFYQQ
jgi:16S rRNA (guanine966-N2)-methyltransferase